MFGLDINLSILLLVCILCACIFEFINGFHDTANAVATVIYTKSLKPIQSVVLSGVMNSIGVFAGGIAVAMGIVNLLPPESLVTMEAQSWLLRIIPSRLHQPHGLNQLTSNKQRRSCQRTFQ